MAHINKKVIYKHVSQCSSVINNSYFVAFQNKNVVSHKYINVKQILIHVDFKIFNYCSYIIYCKMSIFETSIRVIGQHIHYFFFQTSHFCDNKTFSKNFDNNFTIKLKRKNNLFSNLIKKTSSALFNVFINQYQIFYYIFRAKFQIRIYCQLTQFFIGRIIY